MVDGNGLSGAPTKRFFVSMLPRDIELEDAILDLVDNSVDGAMRQRRGDLDVERPYEGFGCNLIVSEHEFRLTDNCGGIPDGHLDAAFRLGRPSLELDDDLPTIGMYGIGMKRAIFKMAAEATVVSRSQDRTVRVRYTSEWLDPDNDDWDLPLDELDASDARGVEIVVSRLQGAVARRFARETFLDELSDRLGQHFAYIMDKGFTIALNGEQVRPERVSVILSDTIRPFDYVAQVDGVSIRVVVGFYRNLTRQAELEEETEPEDEMVAERAAERAGITVICNDRVILVADRTTITGWGVGTVPKYHPQFRAITGVITFWSDNAELLPISTTKRDLDTDSDQFRPARNAAMEGIRHFVRFTNRWKGNEEAADQWLDHASGLMQCG